MITPRVFARMDIKDNKLVKGYQFEGLRVHGLAVEVAEDYYKQGADEILLNDVVASLFGRESLLNVIAKITDSVFIPVTVSGGIRSVNDVKNLMDAGADKVALNSAILAKPELISEIANIFGSQAIVISIEAKQVGEEKWEAYFDSGRENSHRDVFHWIQECEHLGAGEILITSVDRDGTLQGPDVSLFSKACASTNLPIVLSGGFSSTQQVRDLRKIANFDGIAVGKALHTSLLSVSELKNSLIDKVLE